MAQDIVIEEEEQEECPKCPPVGAPAWMATFADMATLLMAFFVLILSFAEFNVPKFKMISGSLKNAFGVQRIVPVVEQPKGTTVISMEFSPSPSPSVTNEITQETTDITQPDVKIPEGNRDGEGEDDEKLSEDAENGQGAMPELDKTAEDPGALQRTAAGPTTEDAEGEGDAARLAAALQEIADDIDIEVQLSDGRVAINLKAEGATTEELLQKFRQVDQAVEIAGLAAGQADEQLLFGGLNQRLNELIAFVSMEVSQNENKGGALNENMAAARALAEQKAESAADELRVKLSEEIGQGLLTVERRENKVFVTVGAGGAFPSGSASLTVEAEAIISEIANVSDGQDNTIVVTGHTDNVPIAFGALYRDNWDLAAARAASVVQSIEARGTVGSGRMQAVSYGETRPLADNETAAGRERNRRIEIELEY